MLYIHMAPAFFIALPTLAFCIYLFCQCSVFNVKNITVFISFKVQDTALCIIV